LEFDEVRRLVVGTLKEKYGKQVKSEKEVDRKDFIVK